MHLPRGPGVFLLLLFGISLFFCFSPRERYTAKCDFCLEHGITISALKIRRERHLSVKKWNDHLPTQPPTECVPPQAARGQFLEIRQSWCSRHSYNSKWNTCDVSEAGRFWVLYPRPERLPKDSQPPAHTGGGTLDLAKGTCETTSYLTRDSNFHHWVVGMVNGISMDGTQRWEWEVLRKPCLL